MGANYYGRGSFATINGFMYPLQIVFAAVAPVGTGYAANITGNYDCPFFGSHDLFQRINCGGTCGPATTESAVKLLKMLARQTTGVFYFKRFQYTYARPIGIEIPLPIDFATVYTVV